MSAEQPLRQERRQWRILAIDDEQSVHETYDAIYDDAHEDELEEIEGLIGLLGEDEDSEQDESSDLSRFQLDHAMGGEEGYQMLVDACELGSPYAVIYLDMRMPAGWDGLQTAEKIREIDSEVRIVLITAYMDYSLTEIRQRIGVNFDFLTKPVDVNELLQLTFSLATQWSQARDLATALVQAEAASRAKDDFLASMSHELRTPLTSIIGNSELMENTSLTGDQQGLMQSIEISSRGLLALINDILDLSKIESGKFTVDQVDFNLNKLLGELSQTFSQQARSAGLSFALKTEALFPVQFVGDERRIGQILINLLSNAVKFTEQGEVSLDVRVEGGRLRFEVEDSGIGMSQEVVERLFKPFEQADQSISRRYGGTGLGLHISATLANLMGGKIEVESREGEGSRFWLDLPCVLSEKDADPVDKGKNSIRATRFTGKVLVAEDTPELQQLECKILQAAGVEVTVANNGKEAVEQGLATPFDLILMDMQMPEMDGIEATRLMRSVGNETPIVALTANVMQQHREQFEDAGCSGFLSKPIDQEGLRRVLEEYLSVAEPEQRFKGRVLVAEDEPVLQQQARELLGSVGVEVVVASHGNEAVEQGLATPFDLILMDLQMPEMGGVEATQLMCSVGCESPIVMLDEDIEAYRVESEAAGATTLLSKPVEKSSLLELLQTYLQPDKGGAEEQSGAAESFVDEELMQLFIERTELQCGLIQQALADEDWGEVRAIAHTVKGSGATFGYPEITRLGKAICDGLDNNEPDPVPGLVRELVAEMEKI